MSEPKYTPGAGRISGFDFRGIAQPYNQYLTADHQPGEPPDDDDPGAAGATCVGVATIHGNATSGGIQLGNARLLCAARNAVVALAGRLGVNAVLLAERLADGGLVELVETLAAFTEMVQLDMALFPAQPRKGSLMERATSVLESLRRDSEASRL